MSFEGGPAGSDAAERLGVIVPVRAGRVRDIPALLRLRRALSGEAPIDVVVVDDGSPTAAAAEIEATCRELGFDFVGSPPARDPFNLSRARNRGLARLANRYVVLEDVDLVVDTDFHRRLLHLATIYIGERGLALLTVPVAYLSQSASAEVLVTADPVGLLDRFKADAVLPDPDRVVGWVAASSVIVFERAAAYRVGGMATIYEGWGFEDFDFAIRLLATGSLPLPPDFWVHDACDYRDQIEWRGWRATMRLHGDLVAYHGLCAFHLHHPVEMTERSADRDRNRMIFLDRLEAFAGGRLDPPMIPGPDEHPLLETRPTEPIEPTRLWLSTLFDRYRTMDFVRRYSPRVADRIIEVRGIGFTKGLRPTTRKLRKLIRSPRTFAVDFWRKLRR